jgi:two-component system, NtrC family, sensor kinase
LFGNGFYAAAKRQKEGSDPKYKPTLKVTMRDLGNAVEAHVRDNGTGIPADIKDRNSDGGRRRSMAQQGFLPSQST